MDAFCFYQEVLYRQARYCLDFQRAYETEQKRIADEERRREKRRRETRERMRKLRKRRREEKLNALQSDCSPQAASEADEAPVGSSKKRMVSADNPAAALITPHKPQEDVPETEHDESNGNHYDDDNVDDNGVHCFDDDDSSDIGVEATDRKLCASLDQRDEGKIVKKDEKVDSKPAASMPATTKASNDQSSEGKVGLVLIPLKGANEQVASFTTGTKYMYWPALIYSSYEAFESTFPLDQNTRQVYATISRERMLHETHEIAMWAQHGIIPPGTCSPQPIRVAILFGGDVPPCGTRSYPIYPKDITIVRGGVPQMPQVSLKTNGFKNISDYASNPKFQEAVQSAKAYRATKDTNMLASLELR